VVRKKVVAIGNGKVDCAIVIHGARASLSGEYPLSVVKAVTSFYVEGYRFSPVFRKGIWDGKTHLFNVKSKSMPAGLVPTVVKALKEIDPTGRVLVTDEREDRIPPASSKGFELAGIPFGEGRYDFQKGAAEALIKGKRGILKVATNGGKTEIAAAVTKHLCLPTLFLVPGLELLYQTRKRFATRLSISEDEIGIIGDSQCVIGKWVTVATVGSLLARLKDNTPAIVSAVRAWDVVFIDECHHAAADTFFDVLDSLHSYYRFGLSGTPLDRSDGADLKLIAQTGEVLYEVPNKLLVERGISAQPYVEMIKITEPILPLKGMIWNQVHKLGIVDNEALNNKVVDKVVQYTKQGLQVLVCVEAIAHGNKLDQLIWKRDSRIVHQFINGEEETEVRQKALVDMLSGKMQCLIATSILDEGVDVPSIDVLIFAGGGKAKIKTLQRVGRGLRTGTGKTKLHVVDFANFSHKWLLKHSLQRLETYKAEECFMISADSS
jgi:superfamily II DNA or RNA helicase